MLDLVEKFKGKFKVSFSISGTALEQFQQFNPEVIELFKNLHKTGCVEFFAETYYHSLAFLYSIEEFRQQVEKHRRAIKELFGGEPVTFRNTELVYSNAIAMEAKNMGFKNILAEGVDKIPGRLSFAAPLGGGGLPDADADGGLGGNPAAGHAFPFGLYYPRGVPEMNLLLRNYRLSDDIAFRFSEKSWKEYPLTAAKYVKRLSGTNSWNKISGESAHKASGYASLSDAALPSAGRTMDKAADKTNSRRIINLFMDYETLGEHHSAQTGIFDFFENLISTIINKTDIEFVMPKEVSQKGLNKTAEKIDVPDIISWADEERDLSAWQGNSMQKSALNMIYKLEENIKKLGNEEITHLWRKLQTSDHFYYMSTKRFQDGAVHRYFNYFPTPYDAYIIYCNVVNDLYETVKKRV